MPARRVLAEFSPAYQDNRGARPCWMFSGKPQPLCAVGAF